MDKPIQKKKVYRVGIKPIDRTIQRLVAMTGDVRNQDLLLQIATTVAKIGREDFSRGDLKLINSTLKELRWAFRVFEPYRHMRKVTIFGSARTKETAESYQSARELGQLIAQSGWMVITGASSGIMRAGNEGAGRERSFGVNIRLPIEQEVNPVIRKDSKLIHFKYFFTRKLTFIKESDATVLYPGGFGTHDEGFESLTLVQTGKANPRPIVLVDTEDGSYWSDLLGFMEKQLAKNKMIDPDDIHLMDLARSPQEALDFILNFFKVYHSLRYVHDKTVLRLNHDISDQKIKEINKNFSTILLAGKIERSKALDEEKEETEIAALPRLVMSFNRRNFAKLKLLIDCINQS